jgi:hypothetical protein
MRVRWNGAALMLAGERGFGSFAWNGLYAWFDAADELVIFTAMLGPVPIPHAALAADDLDDLRTRLAGAEVPQTWEPLTGAAARAGARVPLKGQDRFDLDQRRCIREERAVAQQKGVADDLRLLLQPVSGQRAAGDERIIVARPRHAAQRQEDAVLILPDMHHLVDEEALQIE